MSSRDRQNQPNQPRYGATPGGDEAYDDMFIDESWADDVDTPPPAPRRTAPPSRPAARRPSAEPTMDGTAAQIDRLRRAMRQGSQDFTASAPSGSRPAAPRPAPARRQAQASSRTRRGTSEHAPVDSGYDDAPVRPAPSRRSRQDGVDTQQQPAYDPYTQDAYGAYDDVDDEGYGVYDDAYEDDFTTYDEPRRPSRQQRPRPQLTMPALSRPSLPPAIANAALMNDAVALGIVGAGVAGLVAMAILVANRVDSLAPGFATHVSASGVLESIKSESALWNLPLMAAMLTLMSIVMAWFIAPVDRFASRFVLGSGLLIQFVTWVALLRLI